MWCVNMILIFKMNHNQLDPKMYFNNAIKSIWQELVTFANEGSKIQTKNYLANSNKYLYSLINKVIQKWQNKSQIQQYLVKF